MVIHASQKAMKFINANQYTLNTELVNTYFRKNPRTDHRCLSIFFQDEHNLVLPDGRGISKYDPTGMIPSMLDSSQRYRVRIAKNIIITPPT